MPWVTWMVRCGCWLCTRNWRAMAREQQPVADRREILALYGTSFSGGPLSSVMLFFLQLMVVKQAKYLASQSSDGKDWILWKEKFVDGPLCNNDGLPHPKNSPNAYDRPEGYPEECVWFPKSELVPGLGIHYTSTIVYGTAGILLITGGDSSRNSVFTIHSVGKRKVQQESHRK